MTEKTTASREAPSHCATVKFEHDDKYDEFNYEGQVLCMCHFVPHAEYSEKDYQPIEQRFKRTVQECQHDLPP